MDQAIEDLQRARDAIEALPEEAKQTAKTVVACQSNVGDIRIPVLVDGKCVGQVYRERFAGRTWHDSILELNAGPRIRSEEHTSELQSLRHISYAGFCLQTKTVDSAQY